MSRRVLVVAYGGVLGIELFGVRDLLELVNWSAARNGEPSPFLVEFATHDGAPVQLWAGTELVPTRSLATTRVAIDTLVIVGGPVADEAVDDPVLVGRVRRAAARARRVVGVCTGAFLLAEAGLLDGRRCTTHWAWGEQLARRYPAVRVDTDPIFVVDGPVWTAGGVTSGFDLILAMIEEDIGPAAARSAAQLAALYLRRTGSQAQFGGSWAGTAPSRHPLRELQQFVVEHPAQDHSLEALAARMHMSPRHFARVFRAETGTSARRFVESVRLQAARRRLEETGDTVEAIAVATGFGNYQAMRRTFLVDLGLTPAEYRRRFGAVAAPDYLPDLQLVTQ
ncbi:MAG TPA: helix-turn-helix domain-containing protein [Sporichthyaceae bacterium]|jgi:transcriptional regulator GlxA family with amidase domain|nr:helix-turn-helix domain-containing protein [Sporichthyaceae bacterium]